MPSPSGKPSPYSPCNVPSPCPKARQLISIITLEASPGNNIYSEIKTYRTAKKAQTTPIKLFNRHFELNGLAYAATTGASNKMPCSPWPPSPIPEPVGHPKKLPSCCTELPYLLPVALSEAGNNEFLVHINTTASVVNFFHNDTSGLRFTARHPVPCYFTLRPFARKGWTDGGSNEDA